VVFGGGGGGVLMNRPDWWVCRQRGMEGLRWVWFVFAAGVINSDVEVDDSKAVLDCQMMLGAAIRCKSFIQHAVHAWYAELSLLSS